MDEVYMCELCRRLYKPRKVFGVRKLQEFKGYTVDLRLQQFRRVIPHAEEPSMEIIEFRSKKGKELLAQMHEEVTR